MAKVDSAVIIDTNCALSLNRLAREQMKLKLMQDIRTDLIICEIEGWDKANKLKKEQLTKELLYEMYIEKWNGELPNVQSGDQMIMDLGGLE